MAETISKGGSNTIHKDADDLINQPVTNKFEMNEGKCKELRIGFRNLTAHFEPICLNFIINNSRRSVRCAKILGLTVSSDLKWDEHVHQIRGAGRSIIGGGGGANIHIFVFTDCKNN